MAVEFGVLLPTREAVMSGRPETAPMLAMAERAEAAGFDSVWIGDSIPVRTGGMNRSASRSSWPTEKGRLCRLRSSPTPLESRTNHRRTTGLSGPGSAPAAQPER